MLREEKISRPRFFLFFLTGLLLVVLLAAMPDRRPVAAATAPEVREGDIIFHASTSSQSALIRLLTRSPYTHCGLVMRHKGRWLVLEAVQPVKLTPLAAWTARGAGGHYVLKRLKNADAALTPDVLERMRRLGLGMLGCASCRRTAATRRKNSSPMPCPSVSLTILKLSRSMKRNAVLSRCCANVSETRSSVP